jgi:hypothetical protein
LGTYTFLAELPLDLLALNLAIMSAFFTGVTVLTLILAELPLDLVGLNLAMMSAFFTGVTVLTLILAT